MRKHLLPIVNFLYEVGVLSKTPRSFYSLLGHGNQSVAEHTNRVLFIGFSLAKMEKDIDISRLIQMCLFHDLAEARTSDLNYVHQKYVLADEHRAIHDLTKTLPFGNDILLLLQEHKEKKTKEAILAKDADTIEFILSLKEQVDLGSKRAKTWIPSAVKRLKTENAKLLTKKILLTKSDEWWFSNKDDDWWVNRDKKTVKKRF